MDIIGIARAWRKFFWDCAPIGYQCRHSHADRWLRIHSLPDSKRYPENAGEVSEMLRRHNAVATAVLKKQAPIFVFVPQWLDSNSKYKNFELYGANLQLVEIPSLSTTNDESDWVRIAVAVTRWKSGEFDELIHAVGMDRLRVLFADLETGTAYAPYDGGADLFLSDAQAVAEARILWSDWLSEHPAGL